MVERWASTRKEEEKKNKAAEKEADRLRERYGMGAASGFQVGMGRQVLPRMGGLGTTGTVPTAVNGEVDADLPLSNTVSFGGETPEFFAPSTNLVLGFPIVFDSATPAAVSHERGPTSGVAVAPEVVYPNQTASNVAVSAQKPLANGVDE